MAPPAYSDISKKSNDLLGKDFYHLSTAALDVKTTAPNGVTFNVKGKSSPKDGLIAGNVEAKYTDKATGLSVTQGWTTANVLDTKFEIADALTPGFKAELATSFIPTGAKNTKLNLFFVQPSFNSRAFFDLLKGTFTGDFSVAHDGFVAGGEVGYDIAASKVSKYSGAFGYIHPLYTCSVAATNNLSVFSAAYYHAVKPGVEAGAKATWDSATSNAVGIEVASKYVLDPTSFIKGKINDQGIAAIAYNQSLRPGVTLGLGASFNALRLNEPSHKLGVSLSFAA